MNDLPSWLSQILGFGNAQPNQQGTYSVPLTQTNVIPLQQTTSWPDIAKSYGIGVAKDAIDFAGAPGEIRDAVYSGLNQVLPQPQAQPATQYPPGAYASLIDASGREAQWNCQQVRRLGRA